MSFNLSVVSMGEGMDMDMSPGMVKVKTKTKTCTTKERGREEGIVALKANAENVQIEGYCKTKRSVVEEEEEGGCSIQEKEKEMEKEKGEMERELGERPSPGKPSVEQLNEWVNQILRAGPKVWIEQYYKDKDRKQKRKRMQQSRSATASPLLFWPSPSSTPSILSRRASFSSLSSISPCSSSAFSSTKTKRSKP